MWKLARCLFTLLLCLPFIFLQFLPISEYRKFFKFTCGKCVLKFVCMHVCMYMCATSALIGFSSNGWDGLKIFIRGFYTYLHTHAYVVFMYIPCKCISLQMYVGKFNRIKKILIYIQSYLHLYIWRYVSTYGGVKSSHLIFYYRQYALNSCRSNEFDFVYMDIDMYINIHIYIFIYLYDLGFVDICKWNASSLDNVYAILGIFSCQIVHNSHR